MYKREEDNSKVVHSPAMCLHKGEEYLTFYECFHEGWTQQVVVLKKINDSWQKILTLEKGTGNPVLLSLQDKLYLCYSKFKPGTEKVKNVHWLWKNVDMCISEIHEDQEKNSYYKRNICWFQNLCPRVSALKIPGELSYLLPVYDESMKSGYTLLFYIKNNKHNIARHSIMYNSLTPLIQPTVYLMGDVLYMEARNFNRLHDASGITGRYSVYEHTWSISKRDDINNYYESVLIFDWNNAIFRITGREPGRINLGIEKNFDGTSVKLNTLQHGCYPNYFVNSDNQLVVCFTEYDSKLSDKTQITIVKLNDKMEIKERESI